MERTIFTVTLATTLGVAIGLGVRVYIKNLGRIWPLVRHFRQLVHETERVRALLAQLHPMEIGKNRAQPAEPSSTTWRCPNM